jgi:hypothetical protein
MKTHGKALNKRGRLITVEVIGRNMRSSSGKKYTGGPARYDSYGFKLPTKYTTAAVERVHALRMIKDPEYRKNLLKYLRLSDREIENWKPPVRRKKYSR